MTTWIVHTAKGSMVVHHTDLEDEAEILAEFGVRIGLLHAAHRNKLDHRKLWDAFVKRHHMQVKKTDGTVITKKRSMRTRLRMRDQLIVFAESISGLPPLDTPFRRHRRAETTRQRLNRN